MDPDRLEKIEHHLRTAGSMPHGLVEELLSDREWHRARVQVTDDDIRSAGLGLVEEWETIPCVAAWLDLQGFLLVKTRGHESKDRPGIWDDHTYVVRLLARTSHVVNMLARHLGRAPLDVLSEIAEMEVSDG